MSQPASLLTVDNVSEWLQVPRRAVYRLVEAGQLPCLRVGRLLRFDVEAVRASLTATPAPATALRSVPHRGQPDRAGAPARVAIAPADWSERRWKG